ncbi:hypothetical protein F5X97DRAFT_71411 [Nemania serpens]|nr:hypothetical protein F5X97DRAFT_71411 [Nemania serpens]
MCVLAYSFNLYFVLRTCRFLSLRFVFLVFSAANLAQLSSHTLLTLNSQPLSPHLLDSPPQHSLDHLTSNTLG